MIYNVTQNDLRVLYGIIYVIINTVNWKRYVGQSVQTFNCRYGGIEWWKCASINRHLKTSINKYGHKNFKVQILHWGLSENELNCWEIFYIDYFKSNNSRFGYNFKTGGENGISITKEHFLQKSKIKFGNDFEYDMSNYCSGTSRIKIKHLTCGTEFYQQANLHILKTSIVPCPKCKRAYCARTKYKKIVQIDPETNKIIKIFDSIRHAEKFMIVSKGSIWSACKYGHLSRGYKWDYLKNIKDGKSITKRKKFKFTRNKLHDQEVKQIRNMYLTGDYTQENLGRLFGVSEAIAHTIIHNTTRFDPEYEKIVQSDKFKENILKLRIKNTIANVKSRKKKHKSS